MPAMLSYDYDIDKDQTAPEDYGFELRGDESFEYCATSCSTLAQVVNIALEEFGGTWEEFLAAYGSGPTAKVSGTSVYIKVVRNDW